VQTRDECCGHHNVEREEVGRVSKMPSFGPLFALFVYLLIIYRIIRYLESRVEIKASITAIENLSTTTATDLVPQRLTIPSNTTQRTSRNKSIKNCISMDALSDTVIEEVLRHRPLLRVQPKNNQELLKLININQYVTRSLSTSLKSDGVSVPRCKGASNHQSRILSRILKLKSIRFSSSKYEKTNEAVDQKGAVTPSHRRSTIIKSWFKYTSDAVLSSIRITSIVVAREVLYLSKTIHDVSIISFGYKETPKVGEASRAYQLIKKLEILKNKYSVQKNCGKNQWQQTLNNFKMRTDSN